MKEIKGTTKLCALLGNPTEHSLSPLIHNNLAYMTHTDMAYITFCVEKGNLEEALKGAFALGIEGLNVTVPYKREVMNYLVGTDPIAKAIGAVNTLIKKENGYYGYNTDILGFTKELKNNNFNISGKEVVILGAGGVARAIAFACVKEGASKTIILNRTVEKAETIVSDIKEYFGNDVYAYAYPIDMSESLDLKDILLIQTTDVGMYPNTSETLLEESILYEKALLGFDVIYNPFETVFMKKLKRQGKRALNGLPMLLYQGVAAYEMWFDVNISRNMETAVFNKLKEACGIGYRERHSRYTQENIILIGFMGSGKTTLGKWISKHTGRTLIDTDREIENESGRTIKEIFAQDGEAAFRRMETQYLKNLHNSGKKGLVISVGGGTPIPEENREILKKIGTVVYLRASGAELMKRLRYDERRPLLQGKEGEERRKLIDDLLKKRDPAYLSAADMTVRTDGIYFPKIYQYINRRLRQSFSHRKKKYIRGKYKRRHINENTDNQRS